MVTRDPNALIPVFQQGGIFAYPTEAVYGLGCNPDDQKAVLRLLEIKRRPLEKGLILIASDFSQVEKYLKPLTPEQQKLAVPGELTWLYPALESTPQWLTGLHDSLAVRITRHPLAKQCCQILNSALVSTSANLSSCRPAKTADQVRNQFDFRHTHSIDAILIGEVGKLSKPTGIRDSITGEKIR